MAAYESLVFDIAAVEAGDLQTAPDPDGSEFVDSQILEPHPGLVRLDLNVYGKPVASMNPTLRLYRWEPKFGAYCKGAEITLSTNITDTTDGEYRGLTSVEVGHHRIAIALEDCEIGAQLKVVARRVSNGSV